MKKTKKQFIFDSDGLGQLSDGQTGPDNPDDINGFRWVKFNYNYSINMFCIVFFFFLKTPKRLVGKRHILKNVIIQLKYYLNLIH